MDGTGVNILQLASLLGTDEDDDSGRVTRSGGVPEGRASTVVRSGADVQAAASLAARRRPAPAAIWDEDEVVEGAELDDTADPRPRPEYSINFRQQVTTEDIYLQVGNKTPATASCELLVVRVQLPGETLQTTVVDVQRRHLDVRARRWRLSLFLPHPVREQLAKASWDSGTDTLEMVLPVSRELDALNF